MIYTVTLKANGKSYYEIAGEENVMDWFLLEGNSTDDCSDITVLINQFRAKMIDYNS